MPGDGPSCIREWEIRRASPDDLDEIVQLNRALAWESEGKVLDEIKLRAGVAAVLADEKKGWYFVAQRNGEAVGQVLVTWEWSDWRNGWFWWLQSVYVRPEYRRHGVLRSLVKHLESLARQQGDVIGLRLYVEEKNQAATLAYRHLGLHELGYRMMELCPWPNPEMETGLTTCKISG